MNTAWAARLTFTRPNGTVEQLLLGDAGVLPFPHDDPDVPNEAVRQRLDGPPAYAWGTHADLSRLAADVGAGVLNVLNGDGAYSWLAGCAPGAVDLRWGREGLYWSEWTPVLTGRVQPPQPTLSAKAAGRLALPLYDLRASLETDVVTRTYGGTNVGTTGYDCTADSGKGDTVPLLIGRPANVPGKQVNPSSRAIQLDEGPIGGPGPLYDRGDDAGLALAATANSAAFDGVSLTVTQYARDNSRGLVKLGGTLGGDFTCDPIGRTDAGDTAPQAIRWALGRRGVGTIGDSLDDWTSAATIGAWWPGAVRFREVVEMMARSEGAAILPDPLARWQVAVLDVPAAPIGSISDGQVLDIGVDDPDLAVPVGQVTVFGRRNHLTMDRQRQAADLWDTERETLLREEWRRAVAVSTTTKSRWGDDARTAEIYTALTEQAAMEALAARMLALLGPRPSGEPRRSLWVAVEMTAERLGWLPGRSLHLSYLGEGIDDDMLLLGAQIATPARHLMKLRLFG